MKRGVVVASLLAVLLAGVSHSDAAVVKKWSFEPAVHFGALQSDKDLNIESATIAGGSLALSVFPSFQVEVFADSFEAEMESSPFDDSNYKNEYRGLRLIGTFRAQDDVRVMPYVVAGAGLVDTEIDRGGGRRIIEDDGGYGEIGLGARIFLWKTLSLRGEVALRQSRTKAVPHERVRDVTQSNVAFTVYLSAFFFGSE